MLGASFLQLPPAACIVFEDAVTGVEAAHNAGMKAVGIGTLQTLPKADAHLPGGFAGVTPAMMEALLAAHQK